MSVPNNILVSNGAQPVLNSTGTFTRASAQWLINDVGVLTSFASGTSAINSKGILFEAATTNKVTAYGIVPADTLGSELASGTLTIGQKYQITARTDADFTADGAANNTVGTQFVATAATVTLDAGDKVKRVQWGVGEKSYHNGSSFVQNIAGMTLSGDTHAVLSIATDETAITAAGLAGVNPGYKVYKLDNSAGSTNATVLFSGSVGNTNTHSYQIRLRGSGTAVYGGNWSGSEQATSAVSSAYINYKKEGWTAANAGTQGKLTVYPTSVVYFLLPQLEESTSASSICPSAGSTCTRAATVLSYPTTGIWNTNLVEKITVEDNRTLASDTGFWGKDTGVSITEGVAVFSNAASGTGLYKSGVISVGQRYEVTGTVTVTSGKVVFLAGGTPRTTSGTYTETIVASSTSIGAFASGGTFTGTVDNLSVKEVQSIPSGSGTFYWTPSAVTGSAARYLWGSYLDSNNSLGIYYDGTNVTFRKRVGSSNYDATKALTAVSGTTYKVGWRINADYSIDVFVNGTKGTGSADTHAPAATTTYEIGTLNGTNGAISSQIKNFKIYRRPLSDGRL